MKKRGEKVTHIANLFEKYKKTLTAPQNTTIKAFIDVVEGNYGFHIQEHQCTYSPSTKVLLLNLPGPLKTEIFLRKKHILESLKEKLGDKNTPTQIL